MAEYQLASMTKHLGLISPELILVILARFSVMSTMWLLQLCL